MDASTPESPAGPSIDAGPALAVAIGVIAAAWAGLGTFSGADPFGSFSLVATGAVACCLAAALAARSKRRLGWGLVAVACAAWASGHAAATGMGGAAGIGDTVRHLLLVAGASGGAIVLGRFSLGAATRAKLLLDLLPPAIALGVVGWVFVAGPYVLAPDVARPLRVNAVLHGLGFLVMVTLGIAGLLSERRRMLGRATWLLLAGIGAIATGDALWLQPLTGLVPMTNRAADASVGAGFVLIALAGLDALRTPAEPSHDRLAHENGAGLPGTSPAPLLALAGVLALAGAQAVVGEAVRGGVAATIVGAFGMLLFVIARQSIAQRREAHLRREIGVLSSQIDGLMSQVGRDPLTGLLNHKTVHERLDHELAYGRAGGHPVTVVLIDVDNFKTVNDTLGHQAGDRVLRAVAGILESACRATDIAARYAGDEFMLILPGLDGEVAGRVCARIAREVRRINDDLRLGPETRITLSIGVAVTYRCRRSPAQVVAIADAAMYDAKEGGKNQTVVVDADTLVIAPPTAPGPSIDALMAPSHSTSPRVRTGSRRAG